jgi:hypothetical protein
MSQALVAHTYNPNYSGGRDQEDWVQSQPGQLVLRKTLHKKGLAEWLKV